MGTFELTSDWLGITGSRRTRFVGDLRPPYRLEVHVTKGPPAYVGATIALHADIGTDPAGRRERPQKASTGTYLPQTSRRALQTSPTVALARSASFIG